MLPADEAARSAFSLSLGMVLAAGCGAKVVVDPLGSGGGGAGGMGAGGTGPVAESVGPSVGSVGPSVGSVGPGPSSVTSVSTGPMSCDGQGDCNACLSCGIGSVCADLWNKCQTFQPCNQLLGCLNGCMDTQCNQKCAQAFPDGVDLYNQMASCLICDACYGDCDGATQGC